ncbi:MAG TPA: ankyrin repeat domain-containing protein [bacterium]|nr:ankyrin repeat domain-containing protein [bacterium]
MKIKSATIIFSVFVLLFSSCKSDRVDAATYKAREKLVMLGNDFTDEGFIKAVKANKFDTVKLYLDSGMSPDTTSKIGTIDVPAIFFALEKQSDIIVQMLIRTGTDLKKQTKGVTVLMKAVEKGNTATVALVVEKGADVNQSGENGLTPLMIAIEKQNMDAFWLLTKSGADVNKSDISGITPLMRAVRVGNVDMVRELLKKGANVNAESKNGLKIEKVITEKTREEMIILLKQAGLKI